MMAGESIDEGSLKMKRKAGKYAAVLLAALMLTGCGSNLLEEGTALLEEGNYEKAGEGLALPGGSSRTTREPWRPFSLCWTMEGKRPESSTISWGAVPCSWGSPRRR